MQLILASASPRRRDILTSFGVPFSVCPSNAEEDSTERDPSRLVEDLSKRKGMEVCRRLASTGTLPPDALILSSDTVVSVDGEILGKPRDDADARRMLRLLSGRGHDVVSGVCFTTGDSRQVASHDVTHVFFDNLTDADIDDYLANERVSDKAGAYAIQGRAAAFIRGIEGDYFNVVGLPFHELARLFEETFGKKFLASITGAKEA